MNFSENLNRICKERGITVTALLKEMGLSTSKVTLWNNGSIPKQDMMRELAHRLNCSVMDFFQDDEELQIHESGYIALDEDEQEIIKFFRKISLKERHIFMARIYSQEEEMAKRKE